MPTKLVAHKSNAPAAPISDEVMQQLSDSYPSEPSALKIQLPRISMTAKDITEGQGKNKKVVTEAGTFFIERPTDEKDEEGKFIWEKTEIGKEFEAVILFKRKQLKYYDKTTKLFTSSPVYDEDTDSVPLFCKKEEVGRGTPKELKAEYEYVGEDGKTRSKLEDNRILYVQYEGEIFQMNLRGGSMYAFKTYASKIVPPAFLTKFSSEFKENGSNAWNQATFEAVRPLNGKEAQAVLTEVNKIKTAIKIEKDQYGGGKSDSFDKQAGELSAGGNKALKGN
jgi:hypothetical protein